MISSVKSGKIDKKGIINMNKGVDISINNGFVPVLSERSLQMEATDEVLNDLIGILYRKLMTISIKDSGVDKENMINQKIQQLNDLSKNLLDYDVKGLIDLRDDKRLEINEFIINI